jgi:uncharacterized RDD family membrane protein YckC
MSSQTLAPLARRLLSLIYEALLLFAVLWLAGLVYLLIEHAFGARHVRALFQVYLVAAGALYFVPQWLRGGQTLPMKTWRMRVATTSGGALSLRRALGRYGLATAGAALFGAGFLWAFADSERQFLHDRLAGTRIFSVSPAAT